MAALNPYQPPAHDEAAPAVVDAPGFAPRRLLRQSQLLGLFVLLLFAVGGYQALKARMAMSYGQLAPLSYALLLLTHFVSMQVAVVPAIVAVSGPVHLAILSGETRRVAIVPGVIGALACLAAAVFGSGESLWTTESASTLPIFYGLLAVSAAGGGAQLLSSRGERPPGGKGAWVPVCYGLAVVVQLLVLGYHAAPIVLRWAPFGAPIDDLAWANALAAVALISLLGSKPSAPLFVLRWFGLVPAVASFVLLRVAIALLGADSLVHDTYAEVASTHAGGAIALLGVLGLLRRVSCEERAGGLQLLSVVGATLASLGLNATTWSMFALGREGMPRRYSQFPIELLPAHRHVTWAALAAGLGVAIFVIASLFSPRDGPSERQAAPAPP